MKKAFTLAAGTAAVISIGAAGCMKFAGQLVGRYLKRSPKKSKEEIEAALDSCYQGIALEQYRKELSHFHAWHQSHPHQKVSIQSRDALTLAADYYAQSSSHKWVILVHGYQGQKEDMRITSRHFYEMDYHVLAVDNRSCGESGGTYIGMGWLERLDLVRWIYYIMHQDSEAQIVLYGISMGASAVMMCAGEELPSNVIAVIEDCGFTSAYDIFHYQFKQLFQLPAAPILYCANSLIQAQAGYSIKTASALHQIKKTQLPILFFHGDQDTFVPCAMAEQLYQACPSKKKLYLVKGAHHTESMLQNPDIYFQRISDFLSEL